MTKFWNGSLSVKEGGDGGNISRQILLGNLKVICWRLIIIIMLL